MLAADYYVIREDLQGKGVIFAFSGYVSETVLFALGEALKHKLEAEATDSNITKKVFSVFVEQVQNIIRYSAERIDTPEHSSAADLSAGLVMVGNEFGRFFVVCGNIMPQSEERPLRHRLQHLATLDKESLREYYRQQLREPEGSAKGGNIGLIEIARRASEPLQFDFLPVSQGQSFFCLKAYI